jgi:hypothetical protein
MDVCSTEEEKEEAVLLTLLLPLLTAFQKSEFAFVELQPWITFSFYRRLKGQVDRG